MSEFEPNLQTGPAPEVEALRSEIQSLHKLLSLTLVLLFIFSLCVNVFLLRQTSAVNAEVGNFKMLTSIWANGGSRQIQAIELWSKLNEYSRTHPDLAPIIAKYSQHISVHTNAPTLAPAPSPIKK